MSRFWDHSPVVPSFSESITTHRQHESRPRHLEVIIIGFGTAENDVKLLPMSFHLGSNKIESAWYRTIKAALGAVFNVRISTAEMILGVLPLTISNKVNSVKHLLKLNIFPDIEDPLKKLINAQTQLGSYSPLTGKIKDVFQFLFGSLQYTLNTSLRRIKTS